MRPTGSFEIASMVTIGRFPTRETGTTQDRVGTPSRWTVQAPHAAMPQPYFVPVIFNSSRNTQSNGVPGLVLNFFLNPVHRELVCLHWRPRDSLLRTGHAGFDPLAGSSDNLLMRAGRRRTRAAISLPSGLPCPQYQRLFFVSLQHGRPVTITIS